MDTYSSAVDIEGMTCSSCVKTIESKVGEIPGVLSIQVKLPDKEASVILDPTVVSMNEVVDKINSMGFIATQKSPKVEALEGCLFPGSSSNGASGHQADLASIFSGAGAGDLKRERPPVGEPVMQSGVKAVSSEIGVVSSNEIEQGQSTEKPEKAKQKKRTLSTKPSYLRFSDLHPVVEGRITVVVFDVETSGSANTDEIIQLSATSVHGTFNAYILPLAGICPSASKVHNITKVRGKLYHGETLVPAINKAVAWRDFIRFCEKISPVLLVGHNVNFDARFTLNELKRLNLTEHFEKVVSGFSDTLPLLRSLFPHLNSHTQAKMVLEVMGADYTYECHNSEADVASLMALLQKLNISNETLLYYSFTASSYKQHMENAEEERKMQVLYSPRQIPRRGLSKLAMAGYTLSELERLAKSKSQEDFISILLPVLPKERTSINLYEMIRKF